MAYYVDQVKANVHITAENWKRFQQNHSAQFDKYGSLRYWGPKSFFAHWNPPYFENGDVQELWHRDANGWDETCVQWLELLASYVEDDSEITFHGEDDEWWGYRFENGELINTNAAAVSVPCGTDLEALKHNLVLGELTVEQASQILDILGQLQR